jgi:hypothetical protein
VRLSDSRISPKVIVWGLCMSHDCADQAGVKPLGMRRSGKQRTTDFPKMDMPFGRRYLRLRELRSHHTTGSLISPFKKLGAAMRRLDLSGKPRMPCFPCFACYAPSVLRDDRTHTKA